MSRYALVVGTSEYNPDSGQPNLHFAENDARAIAKLLRNRRIGQFPEFNVTLIINQPHWLIERKLQDIFRQKQREDLVFVYFSCHGIRDYDSDDFYLLASNSSQQYLSTESIEINLVKRLMDQCKSQRKILVLDSCFSGFAGRDVLVKGGELDDKFRELQGTGSYILTASSAAQQALPHKSKEYSLFSYYLIEGLTTGDADANKDGLISINEWFDYALPKVKSDSGAKQTPKRWSLESTEEIDIAVNYRVRGTLALAIKENDTQRVINILENWSVQEFDILERGAVSSTLIETPILSSEEISTCFVPLPSFKRLQLEIESMPQNSWWIVVSTKGTGKTSLISYMVANLKKRKPHRQFFKLLDVPSQPSADDLQTALELVTHSSVSKSTLIIDGDLTEEKIDLLNQLAHPSLRSKYGVFITCTPEEYLLIQEGIELYQDFVHIREDVPGYLNEDQDALNDLLTLKFPDMADDDKQALLQTTDLTFRDLSRIQAMKPKFGYSIPSRDQYQAEIYRQFNSMTQSARLLAQIVVYFESLSEYILQCLLNIYDGLVSEDIETNLEGGFIVRNTNRSSYLGGTFMATNRMDELVTCPKNMYHLLS